MGMPALDDWVLCRLYNKKNEWEKMQLQQQGEEETMMEPKAENTASDMVVTSHSHSQSQSHSHSWGEARTPESEIVDNDPSLFQQAPAGAMNCLIFRQSDPLIICQCCVCLPACLDTPRTLRFCRRLPLMARFEYFFLVLSLEV
ncbi:hypothetical protein TRIUR3_24250 [Triticum urartu]|uniref:NAC domain-containing protein n=1 Tax=Triticum urartu TaxID=4572 RepID=M7Z0W4_TRIUA|nr:hypothetical protein TRIUR3_24250 [Triticum urartu]